MRANALSMKFAMFWQPLYIGCMQCRLNVLFVVELMSICVNGKNKLVCMRARVCGPCTENTFEKRSARSFMWLNWRVVNCHRRFLQINAKNMAHSASMICWWRMKEPSNVCGEIRRCHTTFVPKETQLLPLFPCATPC